MLDSQKRSPELGTMEPPPPPAPEAMPEFVVRNDADPAAERRTQAVKDILSGAILISIGFAFGGSVFLGNPGLLDWFFDGLGTLWIAKGLWGLFTR